MRISDLQSRTVINLSDGKNVGNIIDFEINDDGTVVGFIVEKYKFLISSFSSKKELLVKWNQVKKIGEDVILVDVVY